MVYVLAIEMTHLYAPIGELSSPNYPSNYGHNVDLYWNITVPTGHVQLNFSDFQTEHCSYDQLIVRDELLLVLHVHLLLFVLLAGLWQSSR